jgi:hypothetical protein
MSPIIDVILFSTFEILNKLVSSVGDSEYPTTLAPKLIKILVNQEPLKPVCPVIRIVLPL